MTTYTPTPEAVEAACRAVHPTRWEYRTIAHPCEECATAVTAAGPLIERAVTVTAEQRDEAIRAASSALTKGARQWPGDGLIHDAIPFELADAAVRAALESLGVRIARGEGS